MHHIMKACWGYEGIAPLILYLSTGQMYGQLQVPASLALEKAPWTHWTGDWVIVELVLTLFWHIQVIAPAKNWIIYGGDIKILCFFLLLLRQHNPGIDTPYVSMYYTFRPTAAIIRYIDPLKSPFFLSAVPPYAVSVYTLGVHIQVYCLCNITVLWDVLNINI
jgi:hypothetical protein